MYLLKCKAPPSLLVGCSSKHDICEFREVACHLKSSGPREATTGIHISAEAQAHQAWGALGEPGRSQDTLGSLRRPDDQDMANALGLLGGPIGHGNAQPAVANSTPGSIDMHLHASLHFALLLPEATDPAMHAMCALPCDPSHVRHHHRHHFSRCCKCSQVIRLVVCRVLQYFKFW